MTITNMSTFNIQNTFVIFSLFNSHTHSAFHLQIVVHATTVLFGVTACTLIIVL